MLAVVATVEASTRPGAEFTIILAQNLQARPEVVHAPQ